ncbi:protein PROCA1 [Kryptolebias marmoratus]|uniref:Protein interacting with cyclin A1 n=1 Tax=Kryptolebias marmoratus TaxID=37003 RepID=A0A3Q3B9T1_KRYMA|nr:protein PROCA1 [Kryptolebias marmoratus]
MADDYNQLGEFAETDSCCRVHDHCPHVIHAFSSNYGHTNFKWHSISHCDCDNDLKACLRKVNDTSSRVVGQAFFNVISVPCFDFTYEERCAERRWYGLCKRYEKLPVAVLREAVPYDYGGIDVIDELAVAPPKRKDPEKINEEEQPEGVTQSAMPSPEEPSLGNVVTAAEDFIKVLATVSSSQSSNADSNKDAAQSTEKKKKKKKKKEKEKEKKANRRPKGKGKERKRKQKAKDGDAVSPPGSRAEEVLSLSNFIRESNRLDGSNTNRPDENKLQLRGEDEPSNDVMKDEPAADVSITSPPAVRKGPAEATKEEEPLNVTSPHAENGRGGNEKKKSNELLHPSSEDLELDTDSLDVSHPVTEPQWLLAVGAARAPTLTPKVKRSRSKERGDNGGRKKRKRVGLDAAIVPAEQPNASADSLKVIPPNGVPAAPPVPPSAQQALQGPHVHGRSSRVTASAFSVLKRRRSKERALRSRRRNSSENLLSPHGGSATPRPGVAQGTQETETGTPTVRSDLRWDPDRRQTQPSLKQTKAAAEDPSSGAPWTTTSAAPSVSWLQLSIQRAKAQFNKKKRRKASHSDRQR